MKFHQLLLTALLLVLSGIMIGIMLIMLRIDVPGVFEPTEVTVTEVSRVSSDINREVLSDLNPIFSISEVADAVVPTVVYIETQVSARSMMPNDENHNFNDRFWERILPRGQSNAIGSGVIISPDGFILTNNHVIEGGRNIRVTLADKREFPATVVGRDPSTDLAVIKIDGQDLPNITIGNSDHLRVGDWVMAVGNPLRLRSTVTSGIVSALSRDVQIINDRLRIENFIQTDAAINRGNSGGALVNISGELIGINTAIATESGNYQGYGFAVPINMAFKIGRDLIEFGEVKRAFLGVEINSVNQSRAIELDMPFIRGVEIRNIVQNGSANISGIKRNDVILEIEGVPVNESNQLQGQIALYRPGDEIRVNLWRDGEEIEKNITLLGMENEAISSWAGQPFQEIIEDEETDSAFPNTTILQLDEGLSVATITEDDDNNYQVLIVNVATDSYAYRLGLRENDRLLELNGVQVSRATEVAELWPELLEESEITARILRDDQIVILSR